MPDLLYKTFRIRVLSKLQNSMWYPEALILSDTATGSVGTPIYGKQPYLMKENADLHALKLPQVVGG
jgi:hypothetical protein